MKDIAKFRKAHIKRDSAIENAFNVTCDIIDQYCLNLSKKWPKRTITLWSGMGNCIMETSSKNQAFDFDLSCPEDWPFILPHADELAEMESYAINRNASYLSGSDSHMIFKNGERLT